MFITRYDDENDDERNQIQFSVYMLMGKNFFENNLDKD